METEKKTCSCVSLEMCEFSVSVGCFCRVFYLDKETGVLDCEGFFSVL